MQKENVKLAFSATLHCLLGCGIGDAVGLAIGTIYNWSIISTMALGIILGFAGGYGLTMIHLLKKGLAFKNATKITVLSDTVSIVVMEIGENLTAFLIPGVLTSTISSSTFWIGLAISITAGFLAAYPVNYLMISKGSGHKNTH